MTSPGGFGDLSLRRPTRLSQYPRRHARIPHLVRHPADQMNQTQDTPVGTTSNIATMKAPKAAASNRRFSVVIPVSPSEHSDSTVP